MRDIQDKTDGTGDLLAAEAFNTNLINELQDFVVSAGFTLDPEAGPDTDTAMFSKSVCNYSVGAMYFSESGAADAYVLTRSGNIEALSSYFDGAMVCFNPGNDNTGASTINVDGLGVKDLVAADGTALTGGEVVADVYCIARYNSSTDDFEIVKSVGGDADTLNGLASDTAATADTIAARDSSGDITANAFESTVATGTAPLTVASTTVVSNLNADLLDGQQGSYYAVDANVVHLTGDESPITGQKVFNDLTVNSAQPFSIRDSSGTKRTAMQFVSNVLYIGTTARATNLQSSGTLQYNGTTLASGTIDTTATQTITVVDGLITSIV